MKTLHADLEALMPEPVAHIHSDGDFCWDRKPDVAWWPESLFTADQVREAMQAATERAAKLCDEIKDACDRVDEGGDLVMTSTAIGAEACAKAIRGAGGGE